MLWNPTVTVDESGPSSGLAGVAKDIVDPAYFVLLFAFAVVGLGRLPRRFLVLVILLLGYQTVMAMVFAGTVRYRAPWDFLLCIPAAFGLAKVVGIIDNRWFRPRTIE